MVPTYDVNNKSLAFVIDSTASMVQDRHRIFAMFKQLPSLADLYQKYVTVTFNDPGFNQFNLIMNKYVEVESIFSSINIDDLFYTVGYG